MGTRSWTRFFKRHRLPSPRDQVNRHHTIRHRPRELIGIVYRQFDGYPEGVGKHLVKFLDANRGIHDAHQLQARYVEALETTGTAFDVVDAAALMTDDGLFFLHHKDLDELHLWIEWVYDIEVGTGQESELGVFTGVCGLHLEAVARGTVDQIEAWIEEPGRSEDFYCACSVRQE